MKTHTATSNNNTKRSTSSIFSNLLRISNRKRSDSSDSDTSSLGTEDPIDRYRRNLKEQGFIELDIPKALQKKIDAVNNVLERNQEHNMIDKLSKELSKVLLNYTNQNHAYLTQENHNAIYSLLHDFTSFTKETFKKIFNDKSVTETEYIDLMINPSNKNNNLFHKDSRMEDTIHTNITVIYPMLNQKGTVYIPYNKKNKYPENEYSQRNEDPNYFYDYKAVDLTDVKNADPNKIFVFLCRKASEDLGSDYDDKSLIHAVPEPDDANQARVFMLGRFAVENINSIQP